MAAAALLLAAPVSAHPHAKVASTFNPGPHPAAEVKRWQRKHRWLAKYRPYRYPDGSHWAAPWPVATCESGDPRAGVYGNYFASSAGAYGLTSGGGFREGMPPREQDETVYRVLHSGLYGSFETALYQVWRRWEIEQGCPY